MHLDQLTEGDGLVDLLVVCLQVISWTVLYTSPGNSVFAYARRFAKAVITVMTCCSWKGTSEQHQWTTHCRIAAWQVQ